jgi:hypothetical protein
VTNENNFVYFVLLLDMLSLFYFFSIRAVLFLNGMFKFEDREAQFVYGF